MQNVDGSIENPFDEPKKKRKKKKTTIFVVAEPRNEKDYPIILDVLEQRQNTILLHNRYNYANDKGQEILKGLRKGKELPVPDHLFERVMRQDFWGIKQADVVVFDLDSIESFHLMSVAAVYDKPIVCISETLRPIPAYFTGSVVGVFKLSDLDLILKTAIKGRRKRKRHIPGEEHGATTKQTTSTKEKIQGMLENSFKKHARGIQEELRT